VISPSGGRPRLLTSGGDDVLSITRDGRLLYGSGSSLLTVPLAGGKPRLRLQRRLVPRREAARVRGQRRVHGRARDRRQRLLPTAAASTPSPAAASESSTSAPAPTGPRPRVRQNASSAPCSPAGPTGPSTAQATNAPTRLTAGSGTTTISDDTQPSATDPATSRRARVSAGPGPGAL
jgi:hypothetical protein